MSLWDEKNLKLWAPEWLEQWFLSKSFELQYPGEDAKCTLSFIAASIEGECSLHRSKVAQKPRANFELKMDLDWKCEVVVENGKSFIDSKGEMRVLDFNSEDCEDEFEIKLICDDVAPAGVNPAEFSKLTGKLKDAVRKEGLPKLRAALRTEFLVAVYERAKEGKEHGG